jgi:hypothetical protein
VSEALRRALILGLVLLAGCTEDQPRVTPGTAPPPPDDQPIAIKGSRSEPAPSPRARSKEEEERIARLEASAASHGSAAPAAPLTVLFVGNSYTFVNDLPAWVRVLAASSGSTIATDAVVQGGARLVDHANSPGTLARIRKGGWTHVVLQGQSVEPLRDPARFESGAAALAAEVKAAGAVPVFYETWARRAGDPVYREAWSGGAPAAMQRGLEAEYRKVATACGGTFVPAGEAFTRAVGERPQVALFADDGSHPTRAATYLVACVFLGQLTGHGPVGTAGRPPEIPGADASALEGVAAAFVPR